MHHLRATRRGLSGLATIVLIAACANHGNPDPGGRILSSLTPVLNVIPHNAQVIVRDTGKPHWDSCDGRAGTFGFDPVQVDAEFVTAEAPSALLASAGQTMAAAGWRVEQPLTSPLGPGTEWTRTVPGGARATASLAPGTYGPGSETYWDVEAMAPSHGRQASGC